MAPRIDERYAYLATEEKRHLISEFFPVAIKTRPLGKFKFDKDAFVKMYGYDILTIAFLSDSPLTSPLAYNFNGTIEGAWKLLNKIWGLRLFAKNNQEMITYTLKDTDEYHKLIAKIHIKTQNLVTDFDNKEFYNVLGMLYLFAPNFVLECMDYIKKNNK